MHACISGSGGGGSGYAIELATGAAAGVGARAEAVLCMRWARRCWCAYVRCSIIIFTPVRTRVRDLLAYALAGLSGRASAVMKSLSS